MKHLKLYALLVAGLLMLTTSCEKEEDLTVSDEISLQTPIDDQVIPGRYIVVFRSEAAKGMSFKSDATYTERTTEARNRIKEILATRSISEEVIERTYSSTIFGFAGELSSRDLDELKRDPNVAYIEQDRIIALAPPAGKGPGGGGDGGGGSQTVPYGIARVGGPMDGTGRTAWVIDSGIDLDHPDLNVDVARSVTFVTQGKSTADDGNGHGTHVAGTIAALDNNTGVVGVAAGASVVAVRVLDNSGSGSYSGVIGGVDYVGANAGPGDVANMSLGGPISTALDDAVESAASGGTTFCIAAGNSGANANNYSPSRVSHNNVHVIAAIDSNDVLAYFSNYGNNVDYSAPGVSVESTYKGGGYSSLSGTSMASPHAAGVCLMGNPSTDGSNSGSHSFPIIHL